MNQLPKDTVKIIDELKTKIGNSPDTIIKTVTYQDTYIHIIFNETLSDRTTINKFILEFFETGKNEEPKTSDIIKQLKTKLPVHKITKINTFDDLIYNLFSGFTIILIDGYEEALSIETRTKLDSGVLEAKNEKIITGPKDAFTENYQTNIGLIRKRIKSENLWLEEHILGTKSKTKIGIMYLKDVADDKLVKEVSDKIKNIKIDSILDSSYVFEIISGNRYNVFPNYLSTERPDKVNVTLLDGRIAIIVENTPFAIIVPALLVDFFHSPEDYYQRAVNVNYIRIIRTIAFLLTLLTPALYIAITTHNHEAIPEPLLISFASQREGVPFPSIVEALLMLAVFEILKETDIRTSTALGSALGIVGALVLGEAAVSAGFVSPIMVIIIAITSISSLIVSSVAIVNAARWWRLFFMLGASVMGIIGIFLTGLVFLINVASIKSFGIPFLAPFAPFYLENQGEALLTTNKSKLFKRNILTASKNKYRQAVNK